MNKFLDYYLERPTPQKIGFWIGSFALLTFIFWQYFYSAKSSEVEELSAKIEDLEARIAHEQRLASSLPQFRNEIKALEAKLKYALNQLPDKREIPGLLSSVATLAKDAGLEVRRFAPRLDVLMDFYASVPVDVELKGTYQQVATFFDEVAGLSRIVNVSNVMMRNPEGAEEESHVQVQASCSVTTFRYLDENERGATEQKEKDSKKRKSKKKSKPGSESEEK